MVNSEFEFEVGDKRIWMPIQSVLEEAFIDEIQKNNHVLLYVLFLNKHLYDGQLNNSFFISEFTNNLD